MRRCLDLAMQGIQGAAPNPMVGSVIVCDGKIIGEGYHQKCGQAHAEVNAIKSVADKSLLCKSTLYVNLEPCAHYGKTPPCALAIIENKIPRVVIGCVDSFAKVSGKGIAMMQDAGVDVKVGVLEQESLALNKRFFIFHSKKRPYIFLKWAESIDGFIDADEDAPQWLTNEESRVLVHKMRAEEAAIMVGTVAAVKDNPNLTVRSWKGRNPIRITLDRSLRIPNSHHLLDGSVRTIIFTEKEIASRDNVEFVKIDFTQNVLIQIMNHLYNENLTSLIVEGGEILLNSFIKENLWDEAWQFVGSSKLVSGTKAPQLNASPIDFFKIDKVIFNKYKNFT